MKIGATGSYRSEAVIAGTARPAGGTSAAGATGTSGAGNARSADLYKKLDDYVKMTPAQRMREALLQKLGLTEDELAAMPPEERAAVEVKLRELVQQQMQDAQGKQDGGAKVGQWIDTTA